MADLLRVQPDDTLDGLLAEITKRHSSGGDAPVTLWVPRGVTLLRQMESYQALRDAAKRGGMRLKILSPDARVVGMAMVFGIDASTVSPFADDQAAAAATPAPPPSSPPAASEAARPAPAEPPPPAPGRPVAASVPVPAAEVSETDWLFSGELNLGEILADDDTDTARSATPPPDVVIAGRGAAPEAPPPRPDPAPRAAPAGPPGDPAAAPAPGDGGADLDWLTSGVDLEALARESLNPAAIPLPPDTGDVPAPSMAPPPGPEPVAATLELIDPFAGELGAIAPFMPDLDTITPFTPDAAPGDAGASSDAGGGLRSLLGIVEEEEGGQPMSFAEWLALQSQSAEVAHPDAPPAAPANLDLSHLPEWLRPGAPAGKAPGPGPTAPVLPPPAAGAPPPAPPHDTTPVLRCPHCGNELDKDEMLRLLAQLWSG
ncbi:MAG TPA: hypothetical protein VKY74_25590 [Chloroflexia bacterium]|nr:hypothetical protein [Chloroflexia bacterium]